MKKATLLFLCALALAGCKHASTPGEAQPSAVALGNRFVDAFYSFDRDSLQSLLSTAKESQPEILYYQKWAECAHYKIIDRTHYFERNDSTVIMPVTVKDDLMSALAIDFNVTDTFHITIRNKKIHSVKTSSNDPAEYYQAKEWVKQNRPEFVEKACEGIWAGGPTPCECVQGMIKGFGDLRKETGTNQ
ncbi:MAG TPA: hypothetical protein VL728_07045 [Cyclobacteriaceae bacterium]|jgi:hypothetical protein|nr:hypothetical protein [Cyclobacteriaceae bacterium]